MHLKKFSSFVLNMFYSLKLSLSLTALGTPTPHPPTITGCTFFNLLVMKQLIITRCFCTIILYDLSAVNYAFFCIEFC